MNCQKIDEILSELKVNSRGQIRNKSRVTDLLHSEHLKKVDSELMDIRVFVAQLPVKYNVSTIQKMVDDFIYKKQIS